MDHSTIDISFRFRQLNKMQLLTLSRETEGVSSTENPGNATTAEGDTPTKSRTYSALVALRSENLEAITMFYVRQGLDISNCDILVTTTGVNSTHFTLPVIVNQMLKHIDCPISFCLSS